MTDINSQGNQLKKKLLEKAFSKLNEVQKKAVFKANGPLLILAGAGSGKTTVLVNRIAYLINFENAYYSEMSFDSEQISRLEELDKKEKFSLYELRSALKATGVKPWQILAITFTNKAAGELKDRLCAMLGADDGGFVAAGTFHSTCLRILRSEAEKAGYKSGFTIYDTDDSVRLIKDCLKELVLDDKMFPPKSVLGEIGRAKDWLITPEEYLDQNAADFRKTSIGKIYSLYQKRMKENNAMDFDDILFNTVELLSRDSEVLKKYRDKYGYILVDEYQDTNHVQYELVRLLSQKHSNLCVVGDDDQSIYKFRGATIENILNFEKDFEKAEIVRLEQNYRSTQNILDAANEVISHNSKRKEKRLWTDKGNGEKVTVYRSRDDGTEAAFVAATIMENAQKGGSFADNAILYRMNAQSANVERALVRMAIPYRIIGGAKFYDRKEIKDVMAYLHVIENGSDNIRLKRIVNEPKRGIGGTTVAAVEQISQSLGLSMLEVMRSAEDYPEIARKSASLKVFTDIIDELTEMSYNSSLSELLDELLEKSGYIAYLKTQGFEGEGRIENIEEFKSNIMKYEQENDDGDLGGFLEEIALYTDLDTLNDSDDKVTMMTMHSAKGLEYSNVFIVGMEENLFPSYLSLNSEEELEEERRLAYVALTRAKERLYITNAGERMFFGKTSRNLPSRFLKEIPDQLCEIIDDAPKWEATRAPVKREVIIKPEIVGTVGVKKEMAHAEINYGVGDRVNHKVFGNGKVVGMTKMSNDTLVEIAFDSGITKKIMANYAKLSLI